MNASICIKNIGLVWKLSAILSTNFLTFEITFPALAMNVGGTFAAFAGADDLAVGEETVFFDEPLTEPPFMERGLELEPGRASSTP